MTREEVFAKLSDVFKDVFYDDSIVITDETVAADIDGWDSLMHITLIGAAEDEFGIKFPMNSIVNIKSVGDMVTLIMEQMK